MGDTGSASGVPSLSTNGLQQIAKASLLATKAHGIPQAYVVQPIGGAVVLGFPKDRLPLSPGGKEVIFATRIGKLVVRAAFNLKETIYQGALAV